MKAADLFAAVSDADAERTANALAGEPLDSPTARAYAEPAKRSRRTKADRDAAVAAELAHAADVLGLSCAAGERANAANEAAAAQPAEAFPVMLPDRSWGASVAGDVAIGARIRVTTRGGKSWLATVREVHYSRGGRTFVTAEGDDPPEARTSSRGARRRGRSNPHAGHSVIGGRDYFVNPKGRCIDAPCCGCCT